MKKLSLKSLKFNSQDKLQRAQLKTVLGGYDPNQNFCVDECSGITDDATCAAIDPTHPYCNQHNCVINMATGEMGTLWGCGWYKE